MSRTQSLAVLLLIAAASVRAQKEIGIAGVVLTPDGAPASGGTVALIQGPNDRVIGAIDKAGRFHLVPPVADRLALFITVPGFAPYRVNVQVPPSKMMTLPPIEMLPATYFRARFVTQDGETIAPSVRRRSLDANGTAVPEPLPRTADAVESDGTLTMGPLPPGRAMLTFDRAPFAQMRLPDVPVTEKGGVVDRGTIVVQPGAALIVEIVNTAGSPVPHHDVWLEDPMQPSRLFFSPLRTDLAGRVTFERLMPGRYRVWTRAAERCGNQILSIARLVNVGSTGTRARLVVTGTQATFRFVWRLGPLSGRSMSASPEVPESTPPWLPAGVPGRQGSCGGLTDGDGRVTLTGLPPGATRLSVFMFNSMFSRVVTVPEDGREIVIEIPDGLLPVRVTSRETTKPVGGARLTWKGSGGIVEAITNPNGDALIEAVGAAGGTLRINAREYEEVEGSFDEAPTVHQEVALKPWPPPRIQVRVVDDAGKPVLGAVLHLLPQAPSDAGEMATTDARGAATLFGMRPGALRLLVTADGFAAKTVAIAEEDRLAVVVRLARPTKQP
jgi:hypothetical protein